MILGAVVEKIVENWEDELYLEEKEYATLQQELVDIYGAEAVLGNDICIMGVVVKCIEKELPVGGIVDLSMVE